MEGSSYSAFSEHGNRHKFRNTGEHQRFAITLASPTEGKGELTMTNIHITDRQVGNVIILDIDGQLTMGGSSVALHAAIRRLLEEGEDQILLNLAGVSYVDSSGLGELIASHSALDKKGGQIKLLHLTDRVRELMTSTQLLTLFDVYESESEAVDSFKDQASKPEGHRPILVKGAHHEAHP